MEGENGLAQRKSMLDTHHGDRDRNQSRTQPAVRQLSCLAALHSLDRLCLFSKDQKGKAESRKGSEWKDLRWAVQTRGWGQGLRLLERTKGESQNVPIWQSSEQQQTGSPEGARRSLVRAHSYSNKGQEQALAPKPVS